MALVVFDIEDLERVIERLFGKYIKPYPQSQPDNDDLLQMQEAAKLLEVSISTLHTYKKNGALPFHRIGRRVYFKKSEILESLKKIN